MGGQANGDLRCAFELVHPAMASVNSSLTIVFASSARRIKHDELDLLTAVPALADRALVTRTGP